MIAASALAAVPHRLAHRLGLRSFSVERRDMPPVGVPTWIDLAVLLGTVARTPGEWLTLSGPRREGAYLQVANGMDPSHPDFSASAEPALELSWRVLGADGWRYYTRSVEEGEMLAAFRAYFTEQRLPVGVEVVDHSFER